MRLNQPDARAPTSSAPAEALSLPGRRVAITACRPWADLANARSGRFTHRGITPLTPMMGRTTDPGENRDPGSEQHFKELDLAAPIREQFLRILKHKTPRCHKQK